MLYVCFSLISHICLSVWPRHSHPEAFCTLSPSWLLFHQPLYMPSVLSLLAAVCESSIELLKSPSLWLSVCFLLVVSAKISQWPQLQYSALTIQPTNGKHTVRNEPRNSLVVKHVYEDRKIEFIPVFFPVYCYSPLVPESDLWHQPTLSPDACTYPIQTVIVDVQNQMIKSYV